MDSKPSPTSPITLEPYYPTESPEASSDEELDVDYLCPNCESPRTNDRWCKHCECKRFSEDFQNWTSNNEILDEFIRDTQRNATNKRDYLVWINYDKFEDVVYLAKGGFGEVYYGFWMEGPDRKWIRDEAGKWCLQAKTPVALKCLHDSENLSVEFLNELKAHYKCRGGNVLQCYGITQHKETNYYMLVTKYANEGDLRHYLSQTNSILTWGQKLQMLKEISLGLEEIHSMKLIHRDFHSGNILQHVNSDGKMRTFVTDLGLCRPINRTLKNISKSRDVYGVLPYIAPEILRKTHNYSEASDVYSFGMIMWEILHGKPPLNDIPHDALLAIEICEGFRPEIKKKRVPKWYIYLMIECWDTDPLKRPDIFEVRKIIAKRYLDEVLRDTFVMNLPYKVNKAKSKRRISSHPEAIFTSRLLNYSNLPQPRDVPDISEENYDESSHAYSEFKSNFADYEIEICHADSESEYSSYYSSSDEEEEEQDKIEETDDYITRAFAETLSFGDNLRISSKKQKINSTLPDPLESLSLKH